MKKTLYRISAFLCMSAISFGCTFDKASREDFSFTATIIPIKTIIDEITGGAIHVEVIVPPGASPENYELTPQQLVNFSSSDLIFTTGLIDFEKEIVRKLENGSLATVIDLSGGIDLIEGDCGHSHSHGNHHGHGTDPHIWNSLDCLEIMSETVFNTIMELMPDSLHFQDNYKKLSQKIGDADRYIRNAIAESDLEFFVIYHPALTYYARDYNIEQVSIENEGKEPSADRMKRIIDRAKNKNIGVVLYQQQFSRTVVETAARDIGARMVEFDPLAEGVIGNLVDITNTLIAN